MAIPAGRIATVLAIAAGLGLASACGGDADGNGGGGAPDASTVDAAPRLDDTTVPATGSLVPITPGNSVLGRALCNGQPAQDATRLYFIDGDSALDCFNTSVPYVSWFLDNGAYRMEAGDLQIFGQVNPAVRIRSFSHGTLGDIGVIEDIPESTDVTVGTDHHDPFTFRLEGDEVTVTALRPK